MSEKDIKRYFDAAHAIQSGVQAAMSLELSNDTTPKHLRVGVNVLAMRDISSVAMLLVSKGIFTQDELDKALADGLEAEKEIYEAELSKKLQRDVKLA